MVWWVPEFFTKGGRKNGRTKWALDKLETCEIKRKKRKKTLWKMTD